MRWHPLSLVLLAAAAVTVGLAFVVGGDAAWRRVVVTGTALIVVWALRFAGLFGRPVPV